MEERLNESQPQVYVVINSEAICENKVLWDGVTEWNPPIDLLIVKQSEVGMELEVGDTVAQSVDYTAGG